MDSGPAPCASVSHAFLSGCGTGCVQVHSLLSLSTALRPRGALQLRNPRTQERGRGSREGAPAASPRSPLVVTPLSRVATPRPSPTPCLEQSRLARSFKAAGRRRRACFAPSDAAEVAASPLRRRGDCWEGRRDGGGGTRSRLPVRVKRDGSRGRSGSWTRAQERGTGLRRPTGPGEGLWLGLGEGWSRARPVGGPGPPAGRGRGPEWPGRAFGLFRGGSTGRCARLWEGSSWAGPEVTENPRSQIF